MRVYPPAARFPSAAAAFALCVCLSAGLPAPVAAQNRELSAGPPPEVRAEIEYARALNRLGLPDFSKIVQDRLKAEVPDAEVWLKPIELESRIAVGEFDQVKEIIAREPEPDSQEVWAMKLTLADGYYVWGRYREAQEIYESFFQRYPKGPSETLNEFYLNSAYKYAQMLLLMGRPKDALRAYEYVTKARLEKHVARQVRTEMAELMVKLAEQTSGAERRGYIERVEAICNDILWIQDLWFGKAIVILAHVKLIQGDVAGAGELVEEYMPQLREIHRILKEEEDETGDPLTRLSPMVECRYMLGVMMQEEAEKLLAAGGDRGKIIELLAGKERRGGGRTSGALQNFVTVFVGYPGAKWAADAGVRARRVEQILTERFNARIQTHITPEQMAEVERYQFQEARTLYNQQQFEPAAETYVKVLNLFTERPTSMSALGNLTRCYIEMDRPLYAATTFRYLGERFGRNAELLSDAGDQLLQIATVYEQRELPELRDAVYEVYFGECAAHARAPAMLFRLGERAFADGRVPEALTYYERVREAYTNSPVYPDALNRSAYAYGTLGDHVREIQALDGYIAALDRKPRPGHALVKAQFRRAAAYQQLDPKYLPAAINRYAELIKLLREGGERIGATAEDEKNNEEILKASLFYQAMCFSLLKEPEDRVPAFRARAVRGLQDLVAQFPGSEYAPAALSQLGTLWTILEKPDRAQSALRRLQKEYPESPEARNALFMLGMNLLELGLRDRAVRVFKEMFEGTGEYSHTQILTAGRELLKAGETEIAVQAFDRVLAATKERALREPALNGKGKALVAQEKYEEAVQVLETLLNEYPNSGYTVETCFSLTRAYAELGMRETDAERRFDRFNKAVSAMKRVRRFEESAGGRARSDVEIGRVLTRKAEAEREFGTPAKARAYLDEAIAAYQVLILLGDPSDREVRPHLEEAFADCIPLLLDTERWEDVIENADQYLELFPLGPFVDDVRKWRSRARMKDMMEGGEPGGPPPEPPESEEPSSLEP